MKRKKPIKGTYCADCGSSKVVERMKSGLGYCADHAPSRPRSIREKQSRTPLTEMNEFFGGRGKIKIKRKK